MNTKIFLFLSMMFYVGQLSSAIILIAEDEQVAAGFSPDSIYVGKRVPAIGSFGHIAFLVRQTNDAEQKCSLG